MDHFVYPGIDGLQHAVYRNPLTDDLISIGDSASREGAQAIADEANKKASEAAARLRQVVVRDIA